MSFARASPLVLPPLLSSLRFSRLSSHSPFACGSAHSIGRPAWTAFGGRPPTLRFGHVRGFLDALEATGSFSPPTFRGDKPNLWWAETAPTHHRLFTDYRKAARLLPAAEAFSTFRCLLEGSWATYPDDALAAAWLNLTLDDHGIAPETVARLPCIPGRTPMLCSLVSAASPVHADQIYQLKWARAAAHTPIHSIWERWHVGSTWSAWCWPPGTERGTMVRCPQNPRQF